MKIQCLDCTLRDGAHVNSGKFGLDHICSIVNELSKSNMDIIEIGFLKNVDYDVDITSYPSVEIANNLIHDVASCKSIYSVMVRPDQYDAKLISDCTGPIKLIRIAFYYDFLDKAIDFAKIVKSKGYDFTLNLINTPASPIHDLKKVVDYANEISPYAVSIVDTFGVFDLKSMCDVARYYDDVLNKEIRIGLHVHENMGLSFALAQSFIDVISSGRDIIVDSSLMGMGRAPGNLCTELICDYLIKQKLNQYDPTFMLKAIDKDILPIRQRYKWGYSPEYFVSAKCKVHRSYAEYLYDHNVSLVNMDVIMSQIDADHALKYDEEYITKLLSTCLIEGSIQ